MSSSTLAPVWFKFFLEAGIPPSDAGNYAVTFTENRIQPDMMTDLTKEYLAEMGITVLGDVIAIMKHAKLVHTQTAREKALQCTGLSREFPSNDDPATGSKAVDIQPTAKLSQKQALPAHKKTAAQQLATLKSTPVSLNKTAPISEKLSSPSQNQSVRVTPSEAVSNISSFKPVSKLAKTDSPTNGAKIRLRVAQDDDVVLPQMSRKEGTLKITTNGRVSTVQSQLDEVSQSQSESVAKSSVFNRLGREVSNSSFTTTSPAADKTSFKVTVKGINNDEIAWTKSNPSKQSTSIFNRLGNKTDVQSPVTSSSIPNSRLRTADTKTAVVPVRRPPVSQTVKNLKERLGPPTCSSPSTTVSSTSEGIFGTDVGHSTSIPPAKLRLGTKRPAASLTVEVAVPSQPKQAKNDIKARLGLPTAVATGSTRPVTLSRPQITVPVARPKPAGVFGRLGSK